MRFRPTSLFRVNVKGHGIAYDYLPNVLGGAAPWNNAPEGRYVTGTSRSGGLVEQPAYSKSPGAS